MQQYWRSNLRIVAVLMAAWFVAFGIFFIDPRFWFAQQGSIFVFVILVLAYALLPDRLARKFDVNEYEYNF